MLSREYERDVSDQETELGSISALMLSHGVGPSKGGGGGIKSGRGDTSVMPIADGRCCMSSSARLSSSSCNVRLRPICTISRSPKRIRSCFAISNVSYQSLSWSASSVLPRGGTPSRTRSRRASSAACPRQGKCCPRAARRAS